MALALLPPLPREITCILNDGGQIHVSLIEARLDLVRLARIRHFLAPSNLGNVETAPLDSESVDTASGVAGTLGDA